MEQSSQVLSALRKILSKAFKNGAWQVDLSPNFSQLAAFTATVFHVKGENWSAFISDSHDTAGGVSSEVTVRSLDFPHTLACTTLWEGADGDSFPLWLQ